MKLSLSNFQVHKFAEVEIPEGETTYIEGDSDTGKSAKLRALRWLCENKPDGGSFVTFKSPRGATATATLDLGDGNVIVRERGKTKNAYSLNDQVYEAFGREVPAPVAEVLKLSPYAFQLQGEPPFLIGSTPTEAAKILSSACGLGVIDTAVKFARDKKTVADADIARGTILLDSAQGRLTEAEGELGLAECLECLADLSDAKDSAYNRVIGLGDALADAPTAEALDIRAAQNNANLARLSQSGVQALLTAIATIRREISGAPQGTLYDLGNLPLIREAIDGIEATRGPVFQAVARLRIAVDDEPKGDLYEVLTARQNLVEASVIGKWIIDVGNTAKRIRALIAEEPDGDVMDTTELLKQRAQIKVCPTCGREL